MPMSTAARRELAMAILRIVGSTVLVALLYAIWPLQGNPGRPRLIFLGIGIVVAMAGFAVQVQAVLRSQRPAVRAVEALATSIPLMLVTFAAGYVVMSEGARRRSASRSPR